MLRSARPGRKQFNHKIRTSGRAWHEIVGDSCKARCHIAKDLAGLAIVGCFSQPPALIRLIMQTLALLIGDVDQHVHRANELTLGIEQWVG